MPPVFRGIDNKLEHIIFINPGPTCSSSRLSHCQMFRIWLCRALYRSVDWQSHLFLIQNLVPSSKNLFLWLIVECTSSECVSMLLTKDIFPCRFIMQRRVSLEAGCNTTLEVKVPINCYFTVFWGFLPATT